MSTPVDERPEPTYTHPQPPLSDGGRPSTSRERPSLPSYNINSSHHHANPPRTGSTNSHEKSSVDEGTVVGEADDAPRSDSDHLGALPPPHHAAAAAATGATRPRAGSHLTVQTTDYYDAGDPLRQIASPSATRERSHRLEDDLELFKVERQVSRAEERSRVRGDDLSRTRSRHRAEDAVDEFDIATNPVHEKTQVYQPVENPVTGFAKFMRNVHRSNFLVRYFTYIAPVTLVLLIPLLLGALVYTDATVGGVYLMWFMIWLEIVWLTLWAGRILAKCLPAPIGLVSSLFTNNSKKWRDMGKQLELPATLFFWWLAIEISFLPTMTYHTREFAPNPHTSGWMVTMNKVLVSLFVAATLNFAEKILIQLIAISFHLRTYADRIEINKFQIGSLAKLYKFSKEKIAMDDAEFELQPAPGTEPGSSGTRTPGALIAEAAKTAKHGLNIFGDVAGKVAGDFTGKQVVKSTHPNQVVLALLRTAPGSQVLARRLYRTFAREETETVVADDLKLAFDNDDEATAAFSMFDKDMNGDISMEELEAVCVEIGRERKSITASLKDLDSVVGKLDDVFMFIVFVIVVLVFISLISTSAAGVLTSAGSTVLALSWLFSATAQEFLQSVIFVFVKHPFDVGDRVSIYGNTGALLRGDDYFVKEISLLYTEFKKMEGHIVQAPNSYLNTLFILNQRRSGGLAEAVSITIKFGTTLAQIDALRARLLEFVQEEKREYQGNILTELRDIVEAHAMNLNVVFFYKSNWQNEGLRLARRNKFICALMVTMQELGIEGPRMRYPGQRESFPVYLQHVGGGAAGAAQEGQYSGGNPDNPQGVLRMPAGPGNSNSGPVDPPFVAPPQQSMPEEMQMPASPNVPASAIPSRLRTGSINAPASSMDHLYRRGSLLRSPILGNNNNNNPYPGSSPAPPPLEPVPSHASNFSSGGGAGSAAALTRRVDFSLGMSSLTSSGDLFAGDVYEDRARDRIPARISEVSRDRRERAAARSSAEQQQRRSEDVARATSRDFGASGGLARRSTESGTSALGGRWRKGSVASQNTIGTTTTTHRNRFFGRAPASGGEDAAYWRNLESGVAMEDIPEGATPPSAPTPVARLPQPPIDPRTGTVSSSAVNGER